MALFWILVYSYFKSSVRHFCRRLNFLQWNSQLISMKGGLCRMSLFLAYDTTSTHESATHNHNMLSKNSSTVWAHLYACFFLRHLWVHMKLFCWKHRISQSVMLRGFEGIYKAVKVASILVLVEHNLITRFIALNRTRKMPGIPSQEIIDSCSLQPATQISTGTWISLLV